MSLQKMFFYFLTVLNLNLFAQNGGSYLTLISLSDDIDFNKLQDLNLPVYYKNTTSLLTVINSAQLTVLDDVVNGFSIIDENPVSENYCILSSNDTKEKENSNISEYIIFENENIKILKDYSPNLVEENPLELELSSLSYNPVFFANEKFLPSEFTSVVSDSVISSIVSQIDPDSVSYIIQSLQDFETRFLMTENRFDAAQWIKDKFLQIGFNSVEFDSFMCHTVWQGIDTTTIQVNVVATIQGTKRPNEIYIIGGHYDSYCYGNPFIWAPGADDNASGTAAVLESARVIMESGYIPEATIKFICFGAEELMYFGDAGSEHYALQAYNSGMDIKLMVNNDMISHTLYSVNNSTVDINYYSGFIDMLEIAKSVTEQYTVLTPVNGSVNPGADSYPFYELGYRPIYFEESNFSPYYHQDSDTIGNYNMEYCAEVIKSSCATLLTTMIIPSMIDNFTIVDEGTGSSLLLTWSPNTEPDLVGYNIFVGTSSGVYDSTFSTVDTVYIIDGLIEGTTYFVGISAYDIDGNESIIVEKNAAPLFLPLPPSGFTALPLWHQVELNWNANLEFDLIGYNIYRSDIEGELGDKQNSSIYADTIYVDISATNGVYYYYTVKAVDNQLNESENNTTLRSRVVSLDQGILIVDETADGDGSQMNPTDEQVDDFYYGLFSNFNSEEYDLIEEGAIGLADLGAYSSIIWHGNDVEDMSAPFDSKQSIKEYLEFGGNLLYTGYRPSKAFEQVLGLQGSFGEGDFIYDYLKIDESLSTIFALFYGAIGLETGYNNIFIDSAKTITSNQFHLKTIESIKPTSSGTAIFKYETMFDSTSTQGILKGKPVGVEYIGTDYKTVTLSFPLYYMNISEAKR
jgi:hypothetical protein